VAVASAGPLAYRTSS